MKRNILAICDSEQEYAYHLMDALSRRADFPFEPQVFTSAEKLCAGLAHTPVRILLIAEPDFKEELEALPVGQIILLSEGEPPGGLAHPAVCKYSSVTCIVRKVMEEAGPPGGLVKLSGGISHTSFIGIYTPVRRCLQTTFAFVMGQLLARNHKVLYLNFESYSGLGRMLGRSFPAEFTDLLYFLQGPEEDLLARLYQMVEPVNGMDMLPPAFSGLDISQLKEEEWLSLLRVLEKSRYDSVILDLSDGVQGLYEVLRRCSRVYTIIREDGFAMAKIEQYEEVLRRAEYEDVLEKTKKCRLPVFKKLPRDLNHMTTGELAEFVEKMLEADDMYGRGAGGG